ncbi:hypothetical protein BpHYR1_022596, partial [Brachionus plicatilis]
KFCDQVVKLLTRPKVLLDIYPIWDAIFRFNISSTSLGVMLLIVIKLNINKEILLKADIKKDIQSEFSAFFQNTPRFFRLPQLVKQELFHFVSSAEQVFDHKDKSNVLNWKITNITQELIETPTYQDNADAY